MQTRALGYMGNAHLGVPNLQWLASNAIKNRKKSRLKVALEHFLRKIRRIVGIIRGREASGRVLVWAAKEDAGTTFSIA